MSNVSIMRSIIDDLENERRISLIENPDFNKPDERSLEDQLEQLVFIAKDYKFTRAAKWLSNQIGK